MKEFMNELCNEQLAKLWNSPGEWCPETGEFGRDKQKSVSWSGPAKKEQNVVNFKLRGINIDTMAAKEREEKSCGQGKACQCIAMLIIFLAVIGLSVGLIRLTMEDQREINELRGHHPGYSSPESRLSPSTSPRTTRVHSSPQTDTAVPPDKLAVRAFQKMDARTVGAPAMFPENSSNRHVSRIVHSVSPSTNPEESTNVDLSLEADTAVPPDKVAVRAAPKTDSSPGRAPEMFPEKRRRHVSRIVHSVSPSTHPEESTSVLVSLEADTTVPPDKVAAPKVRSSTGEAPSMHAGKRPNYRLYPRSNLLLF